jgi:hypothetical protein
MRQLTLIGLFAAALMPLSAEPVANLTADQKEIRSAITKSLPLLEATGPIFFKKSRCISCHNVSFPAVAVAAARDKGFQVDEDVARQNVDNALLVWGPLKKRMLRLQAGGVMSLGETLLALKAEGYAPNSLTDIAALWTARTQHSDGSWAIGAFQRPPIAYSPIVSAAYGVWLLQNYAPEQKRKEMRVNVARAAEWLANAQPTDSQEKVFRLLGLHWAEALEKQVKAAQKELEEAQLEDGGWAQLPTLSSDAYVSGQAVYALAEIDARDSASYTKGFDYLLSTQQEDGSWHVKTRSFPIQPYFDSGFPHDHDQWISCAATSWATMALTTGLD